MKLKSLIDYCEECVQLTDEQTEMFLRSKYAEEECNCNPDAPPHLSHIEPPEAYTTLNKRLSLFGMDKMASFHVKLFLSYLCKRPSECIMWAYTLCDMYERKGNVSMITLAEFFQEGFPSEEQLRLCWEHQKSSGEKNANKYDNPDYWEVENVHY